MKDLFTILGLTISVGFSMFLLFSRMKNWYQHNVKMILTTILAIIGLIGFPLSNDNEFRLSFYSLIVPIIYLLFDILFRKLSYKFQGRDFYLYLRFSDDLEVNRRNFSPLDKILSFGSLIIIIGLVLFGVELFGHDDLYNKWF